MNLINSLHLVGCGGVGSKLTREIIDSHQFSLKNIILWDSDVVEEKNLVRQLFSEKDVGSRKAEVLENRVLASPSFNDTFQEGGMSYPMGDFNISSATDMGLNMSHWKENTVVIMATDNLESRLLALQLLDEWGQKDSLIISAANATADDGAGIGCTAWVYKSAWKNSKRDPRKRHNLDCDLESINSGRPCSEDDSSQTNIANSGACQRALELLTLWTHPEYSNNPHYVKHMPVEHVLNWKQLSS